MIKIQILANEKGIADSLVIKDTTLIENAMAIRRLEEIKLELLDMDYDSDLEVYEDE